VVGRGCGSKFLDAAYDESWDAGRHRAARAVDAFKRRLLLCQPKTAHAHGCGYGAAALALITVIAPLCVAAAPDLRQSHSRHHERGPVFWLRSRMSISAPQTGQ